MGLFMARLGGVRLDLFLAHHPMHESMRARRVAVRAFGEHDRYFLSAEDVVLTKLIYRRRKDVLDLERLFAVQEGNLDLGYVRYWLTRIAPEGDPRYHTLDDLERRFGRKQRAPGDLDGDP